MKRYSRMYGGIHIGQLLEVGVDKVRDGVNLLDKLDMKGARTWYPNNTWDYAY